MEEWPGEGRGQVLPSTGYPGYLIPPIGYIAGYPWIVVPFNVYWSSSL